MRGKKKKKKKRNIPTYSINVFNCRGDSARMEGNEPIFAE